MAGHALIASTVTANTSATRGSTTATRAHQRQPFSSLARNTFATRRNNGSRGAARPGGVAGNLPRHATDGRHYEMLRICFTDCASTLEGSGWKLTWARYVVAAPSFGLIAHSSSERMPLAVVLLDWWVETMAYS